MEWFLLYIAASIAWAIYESYRDGAERKHRQAVPCKHGTIGAGWDESKCHACVRENEQEDIKKRRAAELAKQRAYEEWVTKIRMPQYLKQMDPQDFEILVCKLYQRLGYDVQRTRYTSDHGIDGIIRKDGRIGILQCKRFKGAVGEPVLRDLLGTIQAEGAHYGIAVTTGSVSQQAKEWRTNKAATKIEIVELETLTTMLRNAFGEHDIVPDGFSLHMLNSGPCPRCGKSMRLREGRRGKFWGCSNYPTCRGTRNA